MKELNKVKFQKAGLTVNWLIELGHAYQDICISLWWIKLPSNSQSKITIIAPNVANSDIVDKQNEIPVFGCGNVINWLS